eukprot:g10451.t1
MVRKKELQPLQKGEKLDGEKKIAGDLREIDAEGKEKGKVYVRVVNCNFAELKGEDMKEEWAKQCEKARKKGLKQPQRKWYFCWYGSKNEALDAEKWHFPDGFFPLATMTAVHRSPERQESERDQFLVKYSAGSKETLIYRREQGKALDAWVEGLDMANQEIRENMKEEKEAEEMEEKEKAKARMMHGQLVAFGWAFEQISRVVLITMIEQICAVLAAPAKKDTPKSRLDRKEMAGEQTPLMDERAANPDESGSGFGLLAVILIVPRLVGAGIGFGIYKLGDTVKYDLHLAKLQHDAYGFFFVSIYLFSFMVHFINVFPMVYKGKIMKQDAGNLRANMLIYRTLGSDSKQQVILEEPGDFFGLACFDIAEGGVEDGPVGEYNRANRSLGHFVENSAGAMLCMLLAGYVFPFPAAVLVVILLLGRIVHQIGYASSYGKHAPGFMLHMIGAAGLEGLVLMSAYHLLF